MSIGNLGGRLRYLDDNWIAFTMVEGRGWHMLHNYDIYKSYMLSKMNNDEDNL